MLRTGDQYRDSIRDDRKIWMNGERIKDVTTHPAFKPIVDVRARIYDMAHEARYAETMSYKDEATGESNCIGYKLPKEVHFIELDDFPRCTSGKILRHKLEARLRD